MNNTPVKPVFSSPIKLADFWDSNYYNYIEPVQSHKAWRHQGLAEYTNANFVSDFTIFPLIRLVTPTISNILPEPAQQS